MASTSKARALDVSEQDEALNRALDVDERTFARLVNDAPSVLRADEAGRSKSQSKIQVRLSALDSLFNRFDTVAQSTSPAEVQHYEQELADLAKEQDEIESEIQVLKRELEEAQQERAHKLEYDSLAKQIIQYPQRTDTQAAIQRLHQSLSDLKVEREGYRTIASEIKSSYEGATSTLGRVKTYISDAIATREQQAVQGGREDQDDDLAETRTPERIGDVPPEVQEQGEEGEEGEENPRSYAVDSEEEGEEHEEGAAEEARSTLNPAARAFKPSSRTPVPSGPRNTKRERVEGADAGTASDPQTKRRR